MLQVRGLTKAYRTTAGQEAVAVRGIGFEVAKGEIFTLLGPSGCGKTTTLRSVAGLETPDAGEIVVDGVTVFSSAAGIRVPTSKRGFGMVFQSYAIWPHMTVFDNAAFPLTVPTQRRKTAAPRGRTFTSAKATAPARTTGSKATSARF